jgi:hypothetical protein
MATMPGQPPDSTNAGAPAASGALSGELTRQYAIRRLQQQQQRQGAQQQKTTIPLGVTPIRRF